MNQQSFEETLRNSQIPLITQQLTRYESEKPKKVDLDNLHTILGVENPLIQKQKPQKKQIADGKLDFIFNPARDIQSAKIYIEDGDPSMYTEENVNLRRQLKCDKDIIDTINQFMNYYKFDSIGKLVKDEYIKVQIRIIHLLRDDLFDDDSIDELRFTIDQDWEHDSKQKGYMSKDDLFKSLFELVDIWTPNSEKQQYIGFFELLNEKFQYQSKEKLEKKFWDVVGSRFIC